jgi:hypothetical protein
MEIGAVLRISHQATNYRLRGGFRKIRGFFGRDTCKNPEKAPLRVKAHD